MNPEPLEFFASAIPGTERALCDELRELGFASVRLNRGGVPFRGEWIDGWRACLQSRLAQRIQVLLTRFPAPAQDALYLGVRSVNWETFLTPSHTLSVSCVCRASRITHGGFAALKVKDAIVDQIRARTGERPSVSKGDPDVRIFLHLANDKASLYLDMAGEPLHRRGYRLDTGEAPLRETLAASLLRMAEWDRKTPLIDPMCGSGTIAIEGALWAANEAPGLTRTRFGFERWADFGAEEEASFRTLCGELRRDASGQSPKIMASDNDVTMLRYARDNARAAGVRIGFKHRDVLDLEGDGTRKFIVTNPPYGVRLEQAPDFARRLASRLSRLHGWRVCLISGSPTYEHAFSLKPVIKTPVPNGAIDCDFLVYDIP